MWSLFRRRKAQFSSLSASEPPTETQPQPTGVLVRVIGCLCPGYLRVVVGPGIGHLDGGVEQDWPIGVVPVEARFPNREFRIAGYRDGIPQVITDTT
jgi:hypothetical protein